MKTEYTYRYEQNQTGYTPDPDYFVAGDTREDALKEGRKVSVNKKNHVVFVYEENGKHRNIIGIFLNGKFNG